MNNETIWEAWLTLARSCPTYFEVLSKKKKKKAFMWTSGLTLFMSAASDVLQMSHTVKPSQLTRMWVQPPCRICILPDSCIFFDLDVYCGIQWYISRFRRHPEVCRTPNYRGLRKQRHREICNMNTKAQYASRNVVFKVKSEVTADVQTSSWITSRFLESQFLQLLFSLLLFLLIWI